MKVVSAIWSQTMGGPRLLGRSWTADFGAEPKCRDWILFASIFKWLRGWPGAIGKDRLQEVIDCAESAEFVLCVNNVVIWAAFKWGFEGLCLGVKIFATTALFYSYASSYAPIKYIAKGTNRKIPASELQASKLQPTRKGRRELLRRSNIMIMI